MARTRREALDKIESFVAGVEEHLAMLAAAPNQSAGPHWRHEVRTWLRDMEALLRHVGKKTSAQWQARIDTWRAALGSEADEA